MEESDRVTGHRNSPVASEGAQGDLAPAAGSNIDCFLEGEYDDDDLNSVGSIGEKSAQCFVVERKLQDLQNECRTKKKNAPADVAEEGGLAQKFLRSADVPVNIAPYLEVSDTAGGDS